MANIVKRDQLFWFMQATNVVSLSLLLTPRTLNRFGIRTSLSRDDDYLHLIKMFVPDSLLRMWFSDEMPVQVIRISSIDVFFPGVAIECVLGTLQGIWLGLDLVRLPPQGNYRTPFLPALALFLYAGMCISALPLHCLKGISIFDSASDSGRFLLWADTLFTASVPPIMLLSGLVESGLAEPNHERFVWLILGLNATFTWIGVLFSSRWIIFGLHVIFQGLFVGPLSYITRKRTMELDCPHGYFFLKLAMYGSILGTYGAFCFASALSTMTQGDFCPLTSMFLASRHGMVQYWAYCKSQARCNCVKTKKGE